MTPSRQSSVINLGHPRPSLVSKVISIERKVPRLQRSPKYKGIRNWQIENKTACPRARGEKLTTVDLRRTTALNLCLPVFQNFDCLTQLLILLRRFGLVFVSGVGVLILIRQRSVVIGVGDEDVRRDGSILNRLAAR